MAMYCVERTCCDANGELRQLRSWGWQLHTAQSAIHGRSPLPTCSAQGSLSQTAHRVHTTSYPLHTLSAIAAATAAATALVQEGRKRRYRDVSAPSLLLRVLCIHDICVCCYCGTHFPFQRPSALKSGSAREIAANLHCVLCRCQDGWCDQVKSEHFLLSTDDSPSELPYLPYPTVHQHLVLETSRLPRRPWTQLTVCHASTVLSSQRSRALEALFTMSSPFAAKYVAGIYLPSAALLVGTVALKSEWLPYAIALTAVLTGAVLFSSQGMRIDPLGPNSR